jgi:hypothetical protein
MAEKIKKFSYCRSSRAELWTTVGKLAFLDSQLPRVGFLITKGYSSNFYFAQDNAESV